jgi:hypothetical protein
MEAYEYGKEIYQSNARLRNLVNNLEHPEFKQLFQSVKSFEEFYLIYVLADVYYSLEGEPYTKLALIKSILDDSNNRQKICSYITNNRKRLSIANS